MILGMSYWSQGRAPKSNRASRMPISFHRSDVRRGSHVCMGMHLAYRFGKMKQVSTWEYFQRSKTKCSGGYVIYII